MTYDGDIAFLIECIQTNFPPAISREILSEETFRKVNTQCWVSRYALVVCQDRITDDPIDIIEELIEKYEIQSLFSKQELNKKNYNDATDALKFLYGELGSKRGIRSV